MPLDLPTFYKRAGSSVIFVAIMLTGLLWNKWAFLALICLIQVLCLHEFFKLVQKIDVSSYWPKWLPYFIQLVGIGIIYPYLFWHHLFDIQSSEWTMSFWFSKLMWVLLPIIPTILLFISIIPKKEFFLAVLKCAGGLLYIALPMLLLLQIRMKDPVLPMALLLMIWTNDTMAYILGSFVGKTHFTDISPNKTIEGTIGGIVLTVGAATLFGFLANKYNLLPNNYHLIDWMMLALCATIAGTLGDLLESKLKRMADVKDSGTLMPGHGGALDRFDSLLFTAPFAYVYVIYIMH